VRGAKDVININHHLAFDHREGVAADRAAGGVETWCAGAGMGLGRDANEDVVDMLL